MREQLSGVCTKARFPSHLYKMTYVSIINCVNFSRSHWTQVASYIFCAINNLQREYNTSERIMMYSMNNCSQGIHRKMARVLFI